MSTKTADIPEEFQTPQLKRHLARKAKLNQEAAATDLKINKLLSKAKDARRIKFNQQKYVIGGDLLRRASEEQEFQGVKIQDLLDHIMTNLTRNQDRKNFDLEPLQGKETTPPREEDEKLQDFVEQMVRKLPRDQKPITSPAKDMKKATA